MSKEIQLTQGQVAIVDDDNFEYLNQWKWQAQQSTTTKEYYAVRRDSKTKGMVKMHRLVMPESNMFIDHINHNTLDNRKDNLRFVTTSQNGMNRKVNSNKKYKGMCYILGRNRYKVTIMKDGKSILIGYFKDEIAAAKAYDKKAHELFGEYANTNF